MSEEFDLIGEVEEFFCHRYPIPRLWARSIGISLISVALRNLEEFSDEMGQVKANVFVVYVSPSGIGCKTPPIFRIRSILNLYQPSLLAPSRFTVEGFTEHVTGKKKTDETDGQKPQEKGIIIRDELSRIFKERRKTAMEDVLEFLSELWDGHIESYRTRSYGLEGGVEVYFTLVGATTEHFLSLMDEDFFIEGLGNRILYVCQKTMNGCETVKLNPDTFFKNAGSKDEEWERLRQKIVKYLVKIEFSSDVDIRGDARRMWVDFYEEMTGRVGSISEGFERSYLIKLPLHVLKLAMIFAVSRGSVHEYIVSIYAEDMKRAIDNIGLYEKEWRQVINWWQEIKREAKDELSIKHSKYDLKKFCTYAYEKGGLTNTKEISAEYTLPSLSQIGDVLATGVRKGFLEIVAGNQNPNYESEGERGKLTEEEYKRFKPIKGSYPQVFRLTKKGRESYGFDI
jgi:hypothetical protein